MHVEDLIRSLHNYMTPFFMSQTTTTSFVEYPKVYDQRKFASWFILWNVMTLNAVLSPFSEKYLYGYWWFLFFTYFNCNLPFIISIRYAELQHSTFTFSFWYVFIFCKTFLFSFFNRCSSNFMFITDYKSLFLKLFDNESVQYRPLCDDLFRCAFRNCCLKIKAYLSRSLGVEFYCKWSK